MTPPPRRRWPRVLLVVLAVLVVLVVVGVLVLDRVLLSQARAAAADLSRQWGRPVEVGGLATKLVPWLGVRVTGVQIGAAGGEPRPLLELDRAEVKVGLMGALRSMGKRVEVRDLELAGLRVNVLRLPDGTTNLQRWLDAMAPKEPVPEQPPAADRPPADLSFLRVDRAALTGARLAFHDLSRPGAKELAVDQLDVTVRDLAAGRPLDVLLRAALLAERQNLEVKLHAAPLPPTLRPTPERLTVKLEPVDLDPLAPFVPPAAGFQGGRLSADLEVALGAAAPGGSGPTSLRGQLAAKGLRFSGQEGGRPLDLLLDADVAGDAQKGDVKIGKLDLSAGPLTVKGSGAATGLLGASPRIDGLQLVARGLDPRTLAAFYPPLRRAVGDRASGPATVELRAAGAAGAPALDLRVDATAMRLSLPDTLAKAAGAPLVLGARASFPGGAGGGAKAMTVTAKADLAGVDLRPGKALAKGPGDRLGVEAEVDAAQVGTTGWDIALKKLVLLLPADSVTASGKVALREAAGTRKVSFDLAAESARLDLDRLLLPAEKKEKKEEPLSPEAFAGLSGKVGVKVGELRWSKASFRDVTARIRLEGDDLLVEEAHLTALGGRLDAAGTRVRLAHPNEPMRVVAKVQAVDAGEALALFSPRKLLTGRLSADLDVAAGGASGKDILSSLTGSLGGKLFDGQFLGKDLVAGVAAPLAKALPFAAASKLTEGGGTSLGKELPFGVKFTGGAAEITKPMRVQTGAAALSVDGGAIKLDGTLDVPLTVALSPDTVASLTGGRARPPEAIPVTLKLTGPAWSPSLDQLSLQPAVAAIVRSAGTAALGKALGLGGAGGAAGAAPTPEDVAEQAKKKAGEEAKKALRGLLGK